MYTTTPQEKKAWLGGYRPIVLELDSLINERNRWLDRATKVTTAISDMPRGGSGTDSLQQAVEVMADMDDRIGEAYTAAYQKRIAITDAINTVADPTLRQVLRYRYIDGLRYEAIANRMNYSVDNVFCLHRKALAEVSLQ